MTDYLRTAVREEINNNYLKAINIYQEAIAINQQPIDVYINLSFLYWQLAAEFTFRNEHNIPDKYANIGAENYGKIVKKGLSFYPKDRELTFWNKYYPHRLLYESFSYEEALSIIKIDDGRNSLVPYFFLYLHDKKMFKVDRDALLDECYKLETAKNCYIMSIIEN